MKRCKHCGDPIERLEFFDDGRGQWIHTDGTWLTLFHHPAQQG